MRSLRVALLNLLQSQGSVDSGAQGAYGRAIGSILKALNMRWEYLADTIVAVVESYVAHGIPTDAPFGIWSLVEEARNEWNESGSRKAHRLSVDTIKSVAGRRICLSFSHHYLIQQALQLMIQDSLGPLRFGDCGNVRFKNAMRAFTRLRSLPPPTRGVLSINDATGAVSIDWKQFEWLAVSDDLKEAQKSLKVPSDGWVEIEIKIAKRFAQLETSDLRQCSKTIRDLLKYAIILNIEDVKPGCTRLIVRISPADYDALVTALSREPRKALLKDSGLLLIRKPDTKGRSTSGNKRLTLAEDTPDAALESFLNTARSRYEFLYGWDRIRVFIRLTFTSIARMVRSLWITLFPGFANCYELDEIERSESVWFANRGWSRHWAESLRWLFGWPLAAGVLVAIILCLFFPLKLALWSAVSGAAVSLAGGLVCSQVYSIRACSSGGCLLGSLCFAGAHAMVVALRGGVAELTAFGGSQGPFTRIAGGLVGTAAAGFRTQPFWWIAIILCLTVFGIAAAGKMMARPYQISVPGSSRFKRDLRAGLKASGWGAGIGIIALITFCGERLFSAEKGFFLCGAALAGGFAVAASLWVRTSRNVGKTVGFGLATALAGFAVNAGTLFSPPGAMNFFANSLALGLFHAQFFTASFVFGHRTSARAAVIAASVSGIGGYVAFVGFRMFLPDFKL